MTYVREAGSDPAFLLKALSEASGAFRHAYHGLRRRQLLWPGVEQDEDWCLLSLAVHMRDTEYGLLRQVETILASREPSLPHVDLDDIPLPEAYEGASEDQVLDEFHYYRRHMSYMLWDLSPGEWNRGGMHPYRGRLTLLQIAREMYQHDLEHLWQARRMIEALSSHVR